MNEEYILNALLGRFRKRLKNWKLFISNERKTKEKLSNLFVVSLIHENVNLINLQITKVK